jgi:hypothetical protein
VFLTGLEHQAIYDADPNSKTIQKPKSGKSLTRYAKVEIDPIRKEPEELYNFIKASK